MDFGKYGVHIRNALEELSLEDFSRFCALLLEERGDGLQPARFRRGNVEGKSPQELAHMLLNVFGDKAVTVTVALLRANHCNQATEHLVTEAADLLDPGPKWGRSKTQTPASLNEAVSSSDAHFVDRHRSALILRVSNVVSILDHLLQEQVLQREQYDQAMAMRSRQEQMRFLVSGPVKAGGERCKDVLMTALCVQEPALVQDLWKKEG